MSGDDIRQERKFKVNQNQKYVEMREGIQEILGEKNQKWIIIEKECKDE